jgi:hypothetical protein
MERNSGGLQFKMLFRARYTLSDGGSIAQILCRLIFGERSVYRADLPGVAIE